MRRGYLILGTTPDGEDVNVSAAERALHMHVIGGIGKGKSKFLEHLIRQDIASGQGLCLLDPHGELYDNLVRWCATHRLLSRRTIHLLEPGDPTWCFGFNPLRLDRPDELSVRVDAMVNACAQVWGSEDTRKTPLLKRCLKLLFYALALNELTLLEAGDLISASDPEGLRKHLTHDLPDRAYRTQWDDFNALPRRQFVEFFASTNNRLFDFLGSPSVRTVLGQQSRVIDFRRCMDEGEIVLVNLAARNGLSFEQARLLGTLIVSELYLQARRRPVGSRPFYLYIDECYDYLTDDIEKILVQTRKFGLHAVLSHQLVAHLKAAGERVYKGVMSQAQTKVVFGGLDPEDARELVSLVFAGEINLEEPKRAFDKPVTVGHEVITLDSRTVSEAETETESQSSTSGESENEILTVSFGEDGLEIGQATAGGSGRSSSESFSESRSTTKGRSSGKHEALKPVLKVMPTVGYSLEEQTHRAATRLMNQPKRQATIRIPERESAVVEIPEVREGYASAERVSRFREEAFRLSPFASPVAAIEAELAARHEKLRAEAKARPALLLPPSSPEDDETYLE